MLKGFLKKNKPERVQSGDGQKSDTGEGDLYTTQLHSCSMFQELNTDKQIHVEVKLSGQHTKIDEWY